MTKGDPRRAAAHVVSAERDMRRALKSLDLARHATSGVPALERAVMALSDAVRMVKTASVMLVKSADSDDEIERMKKRAATR